MKFTQTALAGAYIVDIEPQIDDRGLFARISCEDEFQRHGLTGCFVQSSLSVNKASGTLRGMHYQMKPHDEVKLVRCTVGAVYDVIIDLRPDSATFTHWTAVELTRENRRALYIPQGLAHGFITLQDGTEVLYQISAPYHGESARGIRWNDPRFAVQWPVPVRMISERDQSYPDFPS